MAGKQELISIVCTLYNYKEYIGELIESALAQTHKNWELLIIDDGSTDNPFEVIKKYDDDRIRYIPFAENKGYSAAKNEGIICALGNYIVMIDADDKLTPESLEVRYKAMASNPDKLWCHGEALALLPGGVLCNRSHDNRMNLRQSMIDNGKNLKVEYIARLVHAQTVMVRKELHEKVGLYDESMRCSSDTEMWDRVIRLGYIPVRVSNFVAIYRKHGRQMHNSPWKKKNMQSILDHRRQATQRRIDEGVHEGNTKLLSTCKTPFHEIIKNHHGHSLGFARHYLMLYSMVLGLETKQAFEFGIGFSTKTILKALEKTGGKLTSCDVRTPMACKVIKKGEPKSPAKWKFYKGRSKDILGDIKLSPLDFVLHDGAHDGWTVMNDLEFIIPKMKKGALLLVHDTDHNYAEISQAVTKALKEIKHERVNLPYGCGLTIVKILEDFGHGSIKTTWKKKKKTK